MPDNKPLSEDDIKRIVRQQLKDSLHRDPLKERFLRAKDLRARFGISDPTTHRWIAKGILPAPEYMNGVRVWRLSTIEDAEKAMLASDQRVETRIGAA